MTTLSDSPQGMSRSDEKVLVDQARRGDRAALRELIDLHKDRLFSFVVRIVGNAHDAEDACQEAFLRAFSALDSFSTQYRFSTWLFTIAYRVCLNSMRRRKAMTGDVDFAALCRHEQPPEDALVESERCRAVRSAVWGAVDELSAPQRAAVLLFYRQEQSCQDIAEIMQVPVATVKSHLHRARARLRESLETQFGREYAESPLRIAAG